MLGAVCSVNGHNPPHTQYSKLCEAKMKLFTNHCIVIFKKINVEKQISEVVVVHSGAPTDHADTICTCYIIQQCTLLRMQYTCNNMCKGVETCIW